jgi:hypothetical protein
VSRLVVAALAVGFAVAAAAGYLTLRPRDSYPLPYDAVRYDAADAKRAFARHGIELVVRSRQPGTIDLTDASEAVEVTVFGDPAAVRRTGFHDLEHSRDCTVAGHLALHWRANVRAIVNCDLVQWDRAWITRVDRALAALGGRGQSSAR